MLLKDYFPNLNKKYQKVSFKGIAFNSRKIKKGYIFFAFKGNNTNGNLFINDAGQIVPIDFGIMGRIDKLNRRSR